MTRLVRPSSFVHILTRNVPDSAFQIETRDSNNTIDPGIISAIAHAIANASMPPTTKERLSPMLLAIDSDAPNRFVGSPPGSLSSFGLADAVLSNEDLADQMDRVFGGKEAQERWADTYVEYLTEVGQKDISEVKDKNEIVEQYFKALQDLAVFQGDLLKAYKLDQGRNVTNLGLKDPSAMAVLDKVTVGVLEDWAKKAVGKEEGDKVGYTKEKWDQYLKANETVAKVEPEFDDLDEAEMISAQGFLYKSAIPTWPAIFNLSMITGGNPNDPQHAQYDAAWSADIINSTAVSGKEADELQKNLDGNFNSSTVDDKTINNEAPEKTSTETQTQKSANATQTGSTSALTSSPTDGGKRRAVSQRSPFPWTRRKDDKKKANKPASAALKVVAQSTDKEAADPPPGGTFGGQKGVDNGNKTTGDDDPLAGVSDKPLVGDLIIVSVDPGAWASRMQDNIAFGFEQQPEIAKKYFGGPKGDGPLGKMWKYMVLVTTYKPNSTDVQSVQVLGRVWEITPGLKDVKVGNLTNSTNHGQNTDDHKQDPPPQNETQASHYALKIFLEPGAWDSSFSSNLTKPTTSTRLHHARHDFNRTNCPHLQQIVHARPTENIAAQDLLANGQQAQQLNAQNLTLDDACSTGDKACISKDIAKCVNDKWEITTSCRGTQQCFALPSVKKAGVVNIACTSERTALSLIDATGATGGVAVASAGTNSTSSESGSNDDNDNGKGKNGDDSGDNDDDKGKNDDNGDDSDSGVTVTTITTTTHTTEHTTVTVFATAETRTLSPGEASRVLSSLTQGAATTITSSASVGEATETASASASGSAASSGSVIHLTAAPNTKTDAATATATSGGVAAAAAVVSSSVGDAGDAYGY
ncbi:hypothetical protein D9758_009225 [Tetrapyrgos nigripes]|uniref:Uncharacterized protein n=1 Tax=Tetrapyrgos nigripes TaxID=182062 RepID=A0A8H5FXB6_9AGAR|nr:hypothetical protein D9758_009225 [Tetrapyrgos nigripes]